jgi:hypothetical protein
MLISCWYYRRTLHPFSLLLVKISSKSKRIDFGIMFWKNVVLYEIYSKLLQLLDFLFMCCSAYLISYLLLFYTWGCNTRISMFSFICSFKNLLATELSVLWFTVSDYPLSIFWATELSVLWFTVSDYSFSIFWPLSCLSLKDRQLSGQKMLKG